MSNDSKDIKYGGFNIRMIANMIDSIITVIFLMPVITIFNNLYVPENSKYLASVSNNYANANLNDGIISALIAAMPSFIFQTILMTVFITAFWFYRYATPGKMIFSLRIADADTFNEPSKKQLFLRYIGYTLSLLPLGIGFLMIYYDKRHQGLHDKISNTVVIYNKRQKLKKSG